MSKIPTLLIVRALKEGKISEPRLDFTYGKDDGVRMDHNTTVLEKLAAVKEQENQKRRLAMTVRKMVLKHKKEHLRDEMRLSQFEYLMNESRDQFGFYTLKSRELLARYAMIILEEEDDQRRKNLSIPESTTPRHSSLIGVSMKDLRLE